MPASTTIDATKFNTATQNATQLQSLINTFNESPTLVQLLNDFLVSGNQIVVGASGSGTKTEGASNGHFTITIDPTYFTGGSIRGPLTAQEIGIELAHELGHAENPGGLYESYDPANPVQAQQDDALAEGVASVASKDVADDFNLYNVANNSSAAPLSANLDQGMQDAINAAGSDLDVQVLDAGAYMSGKPPSNATNLTYSEYWADTYALDKCDSVNSGFFSSAKLTNGNIDWSKVTTQNFVVNDVVSDGSEWTVQASGLSDGKGGLFSINGSAGVDKNGNPSSGSFTCKIVKTDTVTGLTSEYMQGFGMSSDGSSESIFIAAATEATVDGSNDSISADNDDLTLGGQGNSVTGDNLTLTMEAGSQAHVVGSDNSFVLADNSNTELDVSGAGSSIQSNHNVIHVGNDSSDITVTGSSNTIELLGNDQSVNALSGNTVDVDSGLQNESIIGGATVHAGDNDSLSVSGGSFDSINAGNNTAITVDDMQFGASVTVGDGSNVTIGDGAGFALVTESNGHLSLEDGAQVTVMGAGDIIGAGDVSSVSISGNGNTYSGGKGSVSISGDQNIISMGSDASISVTVFGNNNTYTGGAGTLSIESGTGNTVAMGAGAMVLDESDGNTLNLTNASADILSSTGTLNGSGNEVIVGAGTYTVSGDNNSVDGLDGTVVLNLSGASNSVSGDGGTVNLAADSATTLSLVQATINAEAGSTLTVDGDVNSVVASSAAITFTDSDLSDIVTGDNNTIAGSHLGLTINGDGNTLSATNSNITFGGTSGQNLTVTGTGDTITVSNAGATVTYAGPHTSGADINITGAGGNQVIADNSTIDFFNSDVSVSVTGNGDTIEGLSLTIQLNGNGGTQNATFAATNSTITAGQGSFTLSNSGDVLHAADGSNIIFAGTGMNTVYVNNATITVAANQQVTIIGSNNTINGQSNDSMSITGTNDVVTASNSSIVFNGANSGDTVDGPGDGGANWSVPDPELPPGDNGGWAPPQGSTASSKAVSMSPDPNLLVHGLAAFLSQGSSGSFDHATIAPVANDHLHLAMAS